MASVQKTGTLGVLTAQKHPVGIQWKSAGDPAALLATLVADGASPTQAHVTALAAALGGDINIAIDLTKFPTMNTLRRAIQMFLAEMQSSGMLPES